jgi:SanA protein
MPNPAQSSPQASASPRDRELAGATVEHENNSQTGATETDANAGACASSGPDSSTPAQAGGHWSRRLRCGAWWLGIGLLSLIAVLACIDLSVTLATRDAIASTIDEVEPAPVALILGTARTHRGKPNRFYRARIEAAAALFHQKRVRGILVSGDNATRHYNEPIAMQKDLVALGVPAEYITLDYAGFRTLDSIVRAKKVFGLEQVLVVSQAFHAARAIFLARHFELEARGFAAADPPRSGFQSGFFSVRAREVLARAAAILDIVTGRGPRFLGKHETVRLRDEPPREVQALKQS